MHAIINNSLESQSYWVGLVNVHAQLHTCFFQLCERRPLCTCTSPCILTIYIPDSLWSTDLVLFDSQLAKKCKKKHINMQLIKLNFTKWDKFNKINAFQYADFEYHKQLSYKLARLQPSAVLQSHQNHCTSRWYFQEMVIPKNYILMQCHMTINNARINWFWCILKLVATYR